MTRKYLPLLLTCPVLVAGCAAKGPFPSLAPRAVERQYGGGIPADSPCAAALEGDCVPAKPETPPAPPADDAQLRSRIADLAAAARKGQSDFAEALGPAKAGIAGAGAVGSDSWIAAQQQLSRLEAARGETLDALSTLDTLTVERSNQPTSAADLDALTAAATEVRQLTDQQQTELERLRAALSQP